MDIGLAVGRSAADGQLLQGAAEAASGVALEMGQHQHGIVIGDVLAYVILLNGLAVRDGQLQIGAFGIQKIHPEAAQPAVVFKQLAVLVGSIALAGIGGIALDHGAAHMVNDRLPEFGFQEILISFFAGVNFHSHVAGQFLACQLVQLQNLLGGDCSGKINGCAHGNTS